VPSASRHGQTAAEVTNGMDDVVRSHQINGVNVEIPEMEALLWKNHR
jgi:hypothetical protein